MCLGTHLGVSGGAPCPSRLHGVECAEITRGHASLGVFRCTDCSLRSMFRASVGDADFVFPEAAVLQAEHAMLIGLSRGAEATGKSYSEFKRLESEFVLGIGTLVGEVILLSDDADVFVMFLTWLCATRERALLLRSVWRAAGAVMARTRGSERNLTRLTEVKAHFTRLCHMHGEESHPHTAASRCVTDVRLAGGDALEADVDTR